VPPTTLWEASAAACGISVWQLIWQHTRDISWSCRFYHNIGGQSTKSQIENSVLVRYAITGACLQFESDCADQPNTVYCEIT